MKLLFLFGDAAVGKMTVGQELAKITNLRLLNVDKNHRFVSLPGEITFENYIKIDNSELPAKTVAKMIKERFNL